MDRRAGAIAAISGVLFAAVFYVATHHQTSGDEVAAAIAQGMAENGRGWDPTLKPPRISG